MPLPSAPTAFVNGVSVVDAATTNSNNQIWYNALINSVLYKDVAGAISVAHTFNGGANFASGTFNFAGATITNLPYLPLGGGTLTGALNGTAATFSGAITGASFSGSGAALTALNASNLASGTVPSARIAGAYTGITGVGTLTSLALSGAITGATTGAFSGAVTAASFSGVGTALTALNASNLGSGTVPSARMTGAYTGITGVGTLATLAVTATINGDIDGNAATATILATARTINGVSFNGSANITVPAAAGTLTGSALAAGVTSSSLTSVGTLAALAVSGIATVGALKGGGSAPTVTPPAGNGTCTVTGTDTAGFINWTVATTTSAAFSITLTFNSALAANPYALIGLGGGSLAAAPLLYAFGNTTGIAISGQAAAGAPFVAGTVYQFVYHVIS